jgi:hypothetical protein
VIAGDPPKEFAFDRPVAGMSVVWRYTMTPDGDDMRLAESYMLAGPVPERRRATGRCVLGMKDRPAEMLAGLRTTIQRIAVAAEATPSA